MDRVKRNAVAGTRKGTLIIMCVLLMFLFSAVSCEKIRNLRTNEIIEIFKDPSFTFHRFGGWIVLDEKLVINTDYTHYFINYTLHYCKTSNS